MNILALRSALRLDEGVRMRAYQDSVGVWTIGVGHNLQDRPVSQAVVDMILQDDIDAAVGDLDAHVSWWRNLNDVRQNVMVNLCFNMGMARLLTFHKFLSAAQTGEWATAKAELLNSLWASQVGARAVRLANEFETG